MGGNVVQKGIEILNQAGIPTYDTPEKAVRAFLYMVAYSRNLETLMEIPPRFLKKISCDKDRAAGLIAAALNGPCPTLTEDASKAVLEAYGIRVNPVQFALSESEAVSRAERLGYPLAMKLISPDITHKTEADGVHLDLNSPEEIRKSYHRIMQGAKAYNPDARVMGVSLGRLLGGGLRGGFRGTNRVRKLTSGSGRASSRASVHACSAICAAPATTPPASSRARSHR